MQCVAFQSCGEALHVFHITHTLEYGSDLLDRYTVGGNFAPPNVNVVGCLDTKFDLPISHRQDTPLQVGCLAIGAGHQCPAAYCVASRVSTSFLRGEFKPEGLGPP